MPTVTSVLLASALALRADTTVVLGLVERDLTGDGRPEILRLVGVGRTVDSLDVTFSIESSGQIVYRFKLAPLTRTAGFDASRNVLSADQHRSRLREFGPWFLGETKFQRPPAFVDSLHKWARARVAEIPDVISRDRRPSDSHDASVIWQEMRNAPVTIFTFSPGGDAIVAIGWSTSARRFFRLLECC